MKEHLHFNPKNKRNGREVYHTVIVFLIIYNQFTNLYPHSIIHLDKLFNNEF